jgi:phytoene dehydrogenase-like protein
VRPDVLIVGGGLAGLTCAEDLTSAGIDCTVLEAADGVGGRVRTDKVDGFLLDRGFQILLSAYPQVKARLDLKALDLGPFEPGAVVRSGAGMHYLSNPLRRPARLLETLGAPVGSARDKALAALLVMDVVLHPVADLLRREDMSTAERLSRAGFSERFIEAFWRPLFAGIQLDPELEVSSRRFETILRMLALGGTGLPREGIGAVPAQLAAKLPPGTVRTGARVIRLEGTGAVLEDGERLQAQALVVATDGPAAHLLLGRSVPDPGSRAAACCWFAADEATHLGANLLLDGKSGGPALNVVAISEVQASYAPAGRSLVAAAVPGPRALDSRLLAQVREQLAGWFGSMTTDWEHLRTDVIGHGQPAQAPPFAPRRRVDLGEGLFVCGDHRDTASIQGAMFSGERVARAVRSRLDSRSRRDPSGL